MVDDFLWYSAPILCDAMFYLMYAFIYGCAYVCIYKRRPWLFNTFQDPKTTHNYIQSITSFFIYIMTSKSIIEGICIYILDLIFIIHLQVFILFKFYFYIWSLSPESICLPLNRITVLFHCLSLRIVIWLQ